MIAWTLAVSLVSVLAKPFFLPAAVPAIGGAAGATAAIGAGGLVVTSAAGVTLLEIPLAALVAGKVALAGKLLLAKAYLDERNKNRVANRRG